MDASVTSAAFAAKFRSKREVYQFLTVDAKGLTFYDEVLPAKPQPLR